MSWNPMTTDTRFSIQPVWNRFHALGLHTHKSIVGNALTAIHRVVLRQSAEEHISSRRNEWSNHHFSDDSRFTVHFDSRGVFIWWELETETWHSFKKVSSLEEIELQSKPISLLMATETSTSLKMDLWWVSGIRTRLSNLLYTFKLLKLKTNSF